MKTKSCKEVIDSWMASLAQFVSEYTGQCVLARDEMHEGMLIPRGAEVKFRENGTVETVYTPPQQGVVLPKGSTVKFDKNGYLCEMQVKADYQWEVRLFCALTATECWKNFMAHLKTVGEIQK